MMTEERIHELEDMSAEIIQSEEPRVNKIEEKSRESQRPMRQHQAHQHMCNGSAKRSKERRRQEIVFEEIMAQLPKFDEKY